MNAGLGEKMNATLGMWEQVASPEERVKEEAAVEATRQTVAEQFGNEQILGLIRGLFFAGPRQARQVVFSGVGEDARSSEVCSRVAEALASQTTARVCLLNTDRRPSTVEDEFGGARADGGDTPEAAGAVRASPLQLRRNLWLVPSAVWRSEPGVATLPWIRRRLGEMRGEFEYAVIHAPPIGAGGEAETIARFTDGLVLVLEAHRTRRALARMIRQKLSGANIQVLGAVLSGRTFPIPERLYRRL
jgi:Mrp family chromosome partitioning ATPase